MTIRKYALMTVAGLCTTPAAAQNFAFDVDNTRGGVRISSINIDDTIYDDTVGMGVFVESPISSKIKVGGGFDFWAADDRRETMTIRDTSFSGYGKFFIVPHTNEVTPYAVVGSGVHFISRDLPQNDRMNTELSLDMGAGIDMRITPFIAMNGEIKIKNVDNYDHTDISVSVISKF